MTSLQEIIIENRSPDQTPEQALAEHNARDLQSLIKSKEINRRNIRGMRKHGTPRQVAHYSNIGLKIQRQINQLSEPAYNRISLAAG